MNEEYVPDSREKWEFLVSLKEATLSGFQRVDNQFKTLQRDIRSVENSVRFDIRRLEQRLEARINKLDDRLSNVYDQLSGGLANIREILDGVKRRLEQ